MSALPEPACTGCSRLEDDAACVQLAATGETVCTWCDAWREECATRHGIAGDILRMGSKEERHAELDRHEAAYGKVSRDRLAAEVLRVWELRRARIRAGETTA